VVELELEDLSLLEELPPLLEPEDPDDLELALRDFGFSFFAGFLIFFLDFSLPLPEEDEDEDEEAEDELLLELPDDLLSLLLSSASCSSSTIGFSLYASNYLTYKFSESPVSVRYFLSLVLTLT